VDTYQYLLGPMLASWLRASRRSHERPDRRRDVDPLRVRSGSVGYLGTSWVHANRTETITVHGTEAQAWHEASAARLFLARRGQAERKELPLSPADAVVEEIDRVRAVRA